MSNNRGIFEPQEGFAPVPPSKSPFAIADDAPTSPFAVVAEPESPFASLRDDHPARLTPEPGRPAKLPERRPEVPMEARSPFSQEAAPSAFGASPFDSPVPASPFGGVEKAAAPSSPFAAAAQEPPPVPVVDPAPAATAVTSGAVAAAPAPASSAPVETPAPSPAPPARAVAPAPAIVESEESDSRSIRQLELRAIFGVDRELGAEEMLQRSRQLPGIRHVARVPAQDTGAVEALKRLIPALGFPAGQVKLYAGSAPIEFIREGSVMLAVQNDGSFAPGVKETLIIVARELGRL